MESSLVARLMTATVQGSLFLVGIGLICVLLRGLPAAWKCWLWRLVPLKFGLALVLAVSVPVVLPGALRQAARLSLPAGSAQALTAVASTRLPSSIAPIDTQASIAASKPAASIAPPPSATWNPTQILLGCWLAGVALVLCKGIAGWMRGRQTLRMSEHSQLTRLMTSMQLLPTDADWRAPLNVRTVPDLAAPALVGAIRPTILLPSDFFESQSKAVTSALAHELAHLKRRDIGWLLLAELVKALFWFNPLIWIACREQRLEAEIAADQMARRWTATSPKEYAEHLLQWVEPSRARKSPVLAAPGLIPSTHELLKRVKAMSRTAYGSRAATLLGVVILPLLVLGLVPFRIAQVTGSGLASSPWPKFHGGAESMGRGLGGGAQGARSWRFKAGDSVQASPVIGPDGTVYVGSEDLSEYAIDGRTGKKKWSFPTQGIVTSSAALGSNGMLYVGSQDGRLYALNAATGTKSWEFLTDGILYGSPTIGDDGTVYFGSWNGTFYALDAATGIQRWSYSACGAVASTPALGRNGLVYFGSHSKKLFALDAASGQMKWTFEAGDAVVDPAVGPDGTVYVGSWDGNLYALNGETGALKWSYLTNGKIYSCPAIGGDGTVYFSSDDQRVYALDSVTGARKWAFVSGGPIYASPVIGADGTVYVGSLDQRFYALDGVTGRTRWSYSGENAIKSSACIGSDGTLYFGDDSGYLAALH